MMTQREPRSFGPVPRAGETTSVRGLASAAAPKIAPIILSIYGTRPDVRCPLSLFDSIGIN